MNVPKPGGELGAMVYGGGNTAHQQSFGAAAGHMTQLGTVMGAGFQWPDPGQSFPPM
jgi:hypothetical protein